jgi:hypothetical protein
MGRGDGGVTILPIMRGIRVSFVALRGGRVCV